MNKRPIKTLEETYNDAMETYQFQLKFGIFARACGKFTNDVAKSEFEATENVVKAFNNYHKSFGVL